MKASDNTYPKLLFSEVVPATPAAGTQVVYLDPADHKLKRKASDGTVTVIESGSGGGAASIGAGMKLAANGTSHTGDWDIPFDTAETWNDSSFTVDIATGKITVPSAGFYHVSLRMRVTAGISGELDLMVTRGGVYVAASDVELNGTTEWAKHLADVVYCNAGDILTAHAYTSAAVTPKAAETWFRVVKF